MASKVEFQKKDFEDLDLPTLIMKIWTYSNFHNYCDCIVPVTYRRWCIDELKKRWKDKYINFDHVVEKLCQRDKRWKFVKKEQKKI